MRALRRTLQWLSALGLFVATWLLMPRELDVFSVGRDGQFSVHDYAMTNARYVSVRDGQVEMESRARDAVFDLAARKLVSQQVAAKFFDAEGRATLVNAEEATFLQGERKMLLSGGVRTEAPDGFRLEGARAEYGLDRRFFVAPAPVHGYRLDNAIQVWANRAESFLDERKVELVGDARAELREKKRGPTKIRGDRAELDREKGRVEFRQHVRAEQEKLVGTSERAELTYDGPARALKYLSLLDDVLIREPGGRYTRSQVAEFYAPTDTIVLSGFPSVYNGDDVVTGDRITLFRNTGVLEITQTNAAASPASYQKGVKAPAFRKEDEELIP